MRLAVIAAALALCGCTKTVTMVYHTQPEGAVIYQHGQAYGPTPVTVRYAATPEFNSGGCASFGETTARWASGAETTMPDITACKGQTYLQHVVMPRPDAPGLEADIAAAAPPAAAPQSSHDDGSDDLWLMTAIASQAALSRPPAATPRPRQVPNVTPTASQGFPSFPAFGSNGFTAQRIGNNVYYNNGVTDTQIGNATYGNDGYRFQRIGNTTFDNKGHSYQQIGNTTYGSDGTSCQTIGNTTYCN